MDGRPLEGAPVDGLVAGCVDGNLLFGFPVAGCVDGLPLGFPLAGNVEGLPFGFPVEGLVPGMGLVAG